MNLGGLFSPRPPDCLAQRLRRVIAVGSSEKRLGEAMRAERPNRVGAA